LCLGCVDGHSGHERLAADELPAYLKEKMASLSPQLTDGVEGLKYCTSYLLASVDKVHTNTGIFLDLMRVHH
jgi:hypothetical protein